MKLEHWFVVVIGLVIFAYVLDSITNPLTLGLPTPYHFLVPETFKLYPFTTLSILIKAAALVIAPIVILALFEIKKYTKGILIFVLSALYQLYAIQDVATGAGAIPLEWSISLVVAGLILICVAIFYLFFGIGGKVNKLGTSSPSDEFKL